MKTQNIDEFYAHQLSPSNCLKVLISCTSCAIFEGGKNLVRNSSTKSFHEIMESGGWFVNQCLALSPSESGNNLNLSASSVTPLYFTVPHTSMKFFRSVFGFSLGSPWN